MQSKSAKAPTLPPPRIYQAFEGTLGYSALIPEGSLVDISAGEWFDPEISDTVVFFLDETNVIDSFPTDGTGFKVVSISGRTFAGELIPGTEVFDGDGAHSVHYVVLYSGGGMEESARTPVTVKCSKPGGSHPQPVDQVNEKLELIVPNPADVDETTVSLELSIPSWINIYIGDKPTAYIGGQPFAFPAVFNPSSPQRRVLSKSELQTIPGGNAIPVSYKIIDIAGNSSGYAPYIVMDIWTDAPGTLEAPDLYYVDNTPVGPAEGGRSSWIIEQARALERAGGGDAAASAAMTHASPLNTPSEVDLVKVGDDPVKIMVPRYTGWQTGGDVTAHIEGHRVDGSTDSIEIGPKPWNNQFVLEFEVPNEWILGMEGGNVRCWYEAAVAGGSGNNRYLVGRLPDVVLDPPIVAVANEGILDPEAFGPYLEIEVPGDEHLVAYALCTMHIKGITSSGEEVDWEYTDEVPGGHPGESLWFYCERAVIESLLTRPARFSYTVTPPPPAQGEGPAAPSKAKPADSAELVLIIGDAGAPGLLPPPEIHDLVDDAVDPTLPRLLVTVPASGASIAQATVTLTLKAEDTVTEDKRIIANFEPLDFTLRGYPASHDGQEVEASYVILSPDGKDESKSEPKTFYVGSPTRFAEPIIEEAIGDTLDINLFEGNAHIKTEPHDHLRAGMYYWASVVSVTDTEIPYPVANRMPVTADEATDGLRIPIARSILESLPDDSSLKVVVRANIKGTDDPFDVVDFPEKTYEVERGGGWTSTWDLDDLDPAQVTPIKMGGTLTFPLMDVTFTEAAIDPENNTIGVEEFAHELPDYYSGVVFYIGSPQGTTKDNTATITFKRNWSRVRFAMTSLNNDVTVDWLDAANSVIGSETFPGGDVEEGHDAQYASDAVNIRGVRIKSTDVIHLDYFKFLA